MLPICRTHIYISPSKNSPCQSRRFHIPSTSYGRIHLCIPYAAAAARYYATSRLVALHFTCVPTRTCRLHYMISRASVWHSTLSSLLFPFVLTFSFFARSRRPINKTCSLRNARFLSPSPPSLSPLLSSLPSPPLLRLQLLLAITGRTPISVRAITHAAVAGPVVASRRHKRSTDRLFYFYHLHSEADRNQSYIRPRYIRHVRRVGRTVHGAHPRRKTLLRRQHKGENICGRRRHNYKRFLFLTA